MSLVFQNHFWVQGMGIILRLCLVCFCGIHLVQCSKLENWHDPNIEGSIQQEAIENARRNPKIFHAVSKLSNFDKNPSTYPSFDPSLRQLQQGLYQLLQLATM